MEAPRIPDDSSPVLLAFAPGVWGWPDFAGSPRYHLWTLAGMGWRVLYVEPPTRLRPAGRLWRAPDRAFAVLSPGRVAPFAARAAKRDRLAEAWRGLAGRQLARRALAALQSLGWKPDAYWLGAPWHSTVLEALPAGPPAVAHVYDELSLSPLLDEARSARLWRWERELLRSCASAFCSSRPQCDRREGVAERVVHLPNGVPRHFLHGASAPRPVPESARAALQRLEAMPRPRYGYAGVADLRLDPEMFRALLRMDREGSIAFLGKRDPSLDAAFASEIALHPRAAFFGDLPHDALPPLLRACDALLIGHRRMPFTDAMMPEKLCEYLATGRPVASVGLPEVAHAMRTSLAPPRLRVADEPEAWAREAFEAAGELDLRPDLQADRIAYAAEHTWDILGAKADRALRLLIGG